MDITEKVLNALKKAGKPMKSGEVADALNLEKAEVDKAIKKLKKEERIVSPKNCYYQPK